MPRMPSMYKIRYQPQGKVERFYGSRGNYYEFEDGTHLDVHTNPAWCRACGGLTHGERIDSMAQIDQQIADLNDPSSELYRFTQRSLLPELDDLVPKDKFRLDQLAEAHKRRAWRQRRTSPPRCIRCGSTDLLRFSNRRGRTAPRRRRHDRGKLHWDVQHQLQRSRPTGTTRRRTTRRTRSGLFFAAAAGARPPMTRGELRCTTSPSPTARSTVIRCLSCRMIGCDLR